MLILQTKQHGRILFVNEGDILYVLQQYTFEMRTYVVERVWKIRELRRRTGQANLTHTRDQTLGRKQRAGFENPLLKGEIPLFPC